VSEDLKLQQHVIDELEFSPEVESSHIGVTVRDGVVSLFCHHLANAPSAPASPISLRERLPEYWRETLSGMRQYA